MDEPKAAENTIATDTPFKVSVILVCYNSRQWLTKCLESLRAQTINSEIEIIVVDNASTDGSQELAEKLTNGWLNARVVQTGRNLGFGGGNNVGARVARGRYLYFLNPDTWFERDCLEQLYLTTEREHAGGAGATVLEYEDDTLQAKGSDGFDLFGNPVSPSRGRDPQPLFCIAGFYFIRRDLFMRLGMMDEKFFMYGEEMDLSWRIWISGEKIVYAKAARMHHRGAVAVNPAGGTKTVENRTSTLKRYLANRNFLLVIAKNGQHFLTLMLISCVALMLAEGVATILITRSGAVVRRTCLDAIADFWRLRDHVCEQRCHIKGLRRRSDFWMLRFLRLGFGRGHEVASILRRGFPEFNR